MSRNWKAKFDSGDVVMVKGTHPCPMSVRLVPQVEGETYVVDYMDFNGKWRTAEFYEEQLTMYVREPKEDSNG